MRGIWSEGATSIGENVVGNREDREQNISPVELIVNVPAEHKNRLPYQVQKQIPENNKLEMYFVVYNDSEQITERAAESTDRWQPRQLIAQPWLMNEFDNQRGKIDEFGKEIKTLNTEMGIFAT